MQRSSKNVLLIVIGAVVLLIGYRLLFPPPIPDDQQIRDAFQSAVASAQAKDTPGVTSVLSDHFVDAAGYNADQVRLLLSRNIRDVDKIDVSTSGMTVTVKGDTAHTDCYITVVSYQSGMEAFSFHSEVGLDWAKEPATRFLIIPTAQWRIVRSDVGFEGN